MTVSVLPPILTRKTLSPGLSTSKGPSNNGSKEEPELPFCTYTKLARRSSLGTSGRPGGDLTGGG